MRFNIGDRVRHWSGEMTGEVIRTYERQERVAVRWPIGTVQCFDALGDSLVLVAETPLLTYDLDGDECLAETLAHCSPWDLELCPEWDGVQLFNAIDEIDLWPESIAESLPDCVWCDVCDAASVEHETGPCMARDVLVTPYEFECWSYFEVTLCG